LEIRVFYIDAAVPLDRGRQGCEEVRIDVGRERQLRLVEIEAAIARPFARGRRNEAGDAVARRILRETRIVARQDHRNRGVEGGQIAAACRSGRIGRRRRGRGGSERSGGGGLGRGVASRQVTLQLPNARLERLHARRVIRLQRLELGSQRRDVIGGGLSGIGPPAAEQQQCPGNGREVRSRRSAAPPGVR